MLLILRLLVVGHPYLRQAWKCWFFLPKQYNVDFSNKHVPLLNFFIDIGIAFWKYYLMSFFLDEADGFSVVKNHVLGALMVQSILGVLIRCTFLNSHAFGRESVL